METLTFESRLMEDGHLYCPQDVLDRLLPHKGLTVNITLQNVQMSGGRRGIVVEKTTKGAAISNSTVDGARVAGVAIGGHDVTLDGVSVSDARTGVPKRPIAVL